jgi:hypothetical protein
MERLAEVWGMLAETHEGAVEGLVDFVCRSLNQ